MYCYYGKTLVISLAENLQLWTQNMVCWQNLRAHLLSSSLVVFYFFQCSHPKLNFYQGKMTAIPMAYTESVITVLLKRTMCLYIPPFELVEHSPGYSFVLLPLGSLKYAVELLQDLSNDCYSLLDG